MKFLKILGWASLILGLVLTVMLFEGHFASALDFDNSKSFDPQTNEVTVTNMFGLGATIAKIKLDTPHNVLVFAGHDRLVAQFTIQNFQDAYPDALKQIDFFNINSQNQKFDKTFTYKVKVQTGVEKVSILKNRCPPVANDTKSIQTGGIIELPVSVCVNELDTHDEPIYEWQTLSSSSKTALPSGNVTIGIFTDVEVGDHVEWIPTLFGVSIPEWATWSDSLNVGLVAYYNFTSARESVKGQYNMTNSQNVVVFNTTQCLIGGCGQYFTDVNNRIVNPEINFTGNSWTLNFWVAIRDVSVGQFWFSRGSQTPAGGALGIDTPPNWFIQNGWTGTTTQPNTPSPSNDVWTMFTATYSNGNTTVYINTGAKASGFAGMMNDSGSAFQNLTLGANFDLGNDFVGRLDELSYWNRTLSTSEITDLYNGGAGITYLPSSTVQSGNVTAVLLSPSNNTITTSTSLNLTANQTAIGTYNNTNITVLVYNTTSLFFTNTIILSGNGSKLGSWNVSSLTNGQYKWDVRSCGTNSSTTDCRSSLSGNFSFIVDTQAPSVNLNFAPSNQIVSSLPAQLSLSFNASDLNLQNCFYNTTENTTFTIFSCNTTAFLNFSSLGVKGIMFGANDSVGGRNVSAVNFTLGVYSLFESSDPVAEGGTSTFNLTINYTSIPTSSAILNYGNNTYTPDTQSTFTDSVVFGYKLTLPIGFGNSTGKLQFYNWTFNVTGVALNNITTTQNQTVLSIGLSDCSSGGVLILNFTHFIEGNRSIFPISNISSNNLQVDLTLSSLIDPSIKVLYNDTNLNTPYLPVCIASGVLNTTSYRLDLTGSYVGTNYVQEFFYIDNGTINLNAIPQNYSWYDLLTADSTSFLFTFEDENGLNPPNVVVNTLRRYIGDGIFREVERSKADDNGDTLVHLTEEDVIYKFNVTQFGKQIFLSDEFTAKCLQTPCAITLSAQGQGTEFSTNNAWFNLPQGTYSVTANKTTRVVTLLFNLNSSALMNLSIYSYNGTGEQLLTTGSTTGSGGQVQVSVPVTYGNQTFFAVIYHSNAFVSSQWVDLTENASTYFGAMGLIFAFLGILVITLIGASQGEFVIVWLILGIIVVALMKVVNLDWYALMTIISAGGVLLLKLQGRRRIA